MQSSPAGEAEVLAVLRVHHVVGPAGDVRLHQVLVDVEVERQHRVVGEHQPLRLLEQVKRLDPTIFTKSGLMVGLGEERMELHQVMDDMRSADIDFLTIGQYLQPTPRHAKVIEFVEPKTFASYAAIGRANRARAEAEYDEARMIAAYRNLYAGALGRTSFP